MRALRAERTETQEDTAKILGCTKSYLSTIELGKQPIPSGWIEKIIQAYELNEPIANKLKLSVLDITKTVKIDTDNLSIGKKHLAINMAGKIEHMQDGEVSEINEILRKIEGHDMSAMGGWETQEFRLLVGDGSYASNSEIYPQSMFVYFIGYKGEDGVLVDCRNSPKKICLVCENKEKAPKIQKEWYNIKPCTVISTRATVNNIRGLVNSRLFNAELLKTGLNIKNDEQKLFDKYLSKMVLKGAFGEIEFNRVKWWFKGTVAFDGHKVEVRIDKRKDGEKFFGIIYDSLTEMLQKFKEELCLKHLDHKDATLVFNTEVVTKENVLSEIRPAKIECICEYGYSVEFNFRGVPFAGAFINLIKKEDEKEDIKIVGFYMSLNNS